MQQRRPAGCSRHGRSARTPAFQRGRDTDAPRTSQRHVGSDFHPAPAYVLHHRVLRGRPSRSGQGCDEGRPFWCEAPPIACCSRRRRILSTWFPAVSRSFRCACGAVPYAHPVAGVEVGVSVPRATILGYCRSRDRKVTQGQWGPVHRRPAGAVWINDGGHSCRNPCDAFALPEERLREISDV